MGGMYMNMNICIQIYIQIPIYHWQTKVDCSLNPPKWDLYVYYKWCMSACDIAYASQKAILHDIHVNLKNLGLCPDQGSNSQSRSHQANIQSLGYDISLECENMSTNLLYSGGIFRDNSMHQYQCPLCHTNKPLVLITHANLDYNFTLKHSRSFNLSLNPQLWHVNIGGGGGGGAKCVRTKFDPSFWKWSEIPDTISKMFLF